MKNVIVKAVFALLLAMGSLHASAQVAAPKMPTPQERKANFEVMAKKLNLSPAQRTTLWQQSEDFTKESAKYLPNMQKPGVVQEYMNLAGKYTNKMMAVLTPAQRTKYKELIQADMAKAMNRNKVKH